jgi:hypothetical protein
MDAARTGSLAFAGDAYNLLIATTGVSTDIKKEATTKLAVEVNSTNYPEAAWYATITMQSTSQVPPLLKAIHVRKSKTS